MTLAHDDGARLAESRVTARQRAVSFPNIHSGHAHRWFSPLVDAVDAAIRSLSGTKDVRLALENLTPFSLRGRQDRDPPSSATDARWRDQEPCLLSCVRRVARVALHCRSKLGW